MKWLMQALLFSSLVLVPAARVLAADGPKAVEVSKIPLAPAKGTVEFHATGHPSAIKIVGKGDLFTGNFSIQDKKVSGTATFDLGSLKTGIEMRDKHMKEKYLEVEKFPQAKLTLTDFVVPASLAGKVTFDSVPFKGTLALHGVEHAVSGTAKIVKEGDQIKLSAQFTLKIEDYAIAVPKFAGITVADEVEIDVEATSALPSGK